jgi:homopolymeric O-antigen transport system permease protein
MTVGIEPLEKQLIAPSAQVALPYRRLTVRESVVEAWRSRHLLPHLGAEAIRRSFFLTVLGPAWIVLTAFMDIGSKTFLFGGVLDVKTPNGVPYIVFLLTGMLGWTLFQQTLNFGVKSLQRYRRYAARLNMPLLLLPLACGAQALLHFFLYLAVVVAGLAYYALRGQIYFETGARLLLVPYGLALCLLFAWGLSLILAPINYRKRDIRLLMRYVLQFWLYVTPVVYPLESLHGVLLIVAKLNPVAPMTELIKFGLIGGGNVGVRFVLWGTAAAVGSFLLGIVVMNRLGPQALARPLISDGDGDDDVDLEDV